MLMIPLFFSLDRESFIKKCKILLDAFHAKKLTLNLTKSSCMIIQPSQCDVKIDLKLTSGWLPYKSSTIYLGSLFTDSGSINNDVTQHALNKNKSVSIKLANVITNNINAPIPVKYKVLNSCVKAVIMYSCETWASNNLTRIEVLHRKAIKTTLKMKSNTPNHIMYVESGCKPLRCEIYRRQYKFLSNDQRW